jgi:deoxyribonuclease-4
MSILGLKLWSINRNYFEEAKRLVAEKQCAYIELYTLPKSYKEFAALWKLIDIPYVIHAPHFVHGMNLAAVECKNSNRLLAEEAFAFADLLNAKHVIFHPGFAGKDDEIIRQLNQWSENWKQKILIENKPYCSINDENLIANGHSPEVIQKIKYETEIGFCFDIGHGICSANSRNIDPYEIISDFEKLDPVMYHISDNEIDSPIDQHKHLGQGNYNFKQIFERIDMMKPISIETVKNHEDSLLDFEEDINFLKNVRSLI